ncbi:MAG: excinuclease ABC subunit UvrA [Acidobacteria bacterium]|nr:excinuclease ABC subunit UvrA [Acidobacteriota bacterium]
MLDRITVRGARQHNLRDLHLEIPRNSLTVVTGLSGSGKSSLAFDTIYAEGQRRYVETLSPYARQFLDQMERPDVDSIDGLSPALSIEQKTTTRSPRSTVGTITEIYDYLRLLYSSIGKPHCANCGSPIVRQTADQIAERLLEEWRGQKIVIMAPVIRGRKGIYRRELEQFAEKGFLRARIDGELRALDEDVHLERHHAHTIEVIIDRLNVRDGIEKRLESSVRTALKLADGLVLVGREEGEERLFSEKLACMECGASVPAFEPRSFSFNSRYGACPDCNGLGSQWDFDPVKLITDPSKPLLNGATANWLLYASIESAVRKAAQKKGIPIGKKVSELTDTQLDYLMKGGGRDYPGLLSLLREWHDDDLSEDYREWMLRYQSPTVCPTCNGARLRPESLAVKVEGMSIAELAGLPIGRSQVVSESIRLNDRERKVAGRILDEVKERLGFLTSVGLEYLTLDRSAATLSGGEAQRVRLATQIGTKLRGVLYVLDEPSIGLHARDNQRLLDSLTNLRDLGNTILVVEHDQETIERADHVLDLGPGAGRLGGYLVAEGTPAEVAKKEESLTGQYLSGRRSVPVPEKRREPGKDKLVIRDAEEHNLRKIDVSFPLGVLTVVTGVSGSGKSTLVNDILYPVLMQHVYRSSASTGKHRKVEGLKKIDKVVRIDQSPIGRTPRSNPATYSGVFTPLRSFYSMLPEARGRGYQPGRFSFNVKGGRCEACQGDGNRRIEMSFLPDVFVTCDVCRGRRYNQETMQVKYNGSSIADVLESTVEQAQGLFENLPQVYTKLKTLSEVGLDYIRLGQSSTTLSGGEAQRIKLARELSKRQTGQTVYLLDEPTTGLHFEDVRKLLEVLQRLVDLGNTVIIIEHNLDVIKSADWIIDLGPEGGDGGGTIVAAGSPEEIAQVAGSYTGRELAKALGPRLLG